MSIYLGQLGRMVGLKCPASQRTSSEGRYTFTTTIEGRRNAQARPTSRRVWDLQTSDAATPEQVAAIMAFVQGAWGPGPFIFVSAEAQYTNMLVPSASLCAPEDQWQTDVVMAGPVMLPDGRMVPSAYASAAPTTYLFGRGIYPVPPNGGPFTASVVVQGDTARARLNWYDAQKAYLGSTTSTTAGTAGGLTVSRVTGIPPAGAVGVGVGAFTALLCTAPTLVWGDSPAPWTTGRGCLEAVPHAPSSDLVLTGPGRTYSNLSFTVTELG